MNIPKPENNTASVSRSNRIAGFANPSLTDINETPPVSTWISWLVAFTIVAVFAYMRLFFRPIDRPVVPIPYTIPLLLFLWLRHRQPMWAAAFGIGVVSLTRIVLLAQLGKSGPRIEQMLDAIVTIVSLIAVTTVLHQLIGARRAVQRRNSELTAGNLQLIHRDEEISRQNEELQSQTEELERQSEELRMANDDLANRERMLEHLLALSRSLTVDLERGEMLSVVCEALGFLMGGRSLAAAMLERGGDGFTISCHHGFGHEGPASSSLPFQQSLAALVLQRMQTAFIEDISLQPELIIPQPLNGPPLRSALAAPLRVRGKGIGTLEIYSNERRTWSDKDISLIESLAAQTVISLETAQLFHDVERERGRFAAVLRTLPIGIAVASADGSDIRLNPAGAALLNLTLDANLAQSETARNWKLFQGGEPLPQENNPLRRALRNREEPTNEEIDLVLPSGRRLSLLVSAAPILDRDGAPSGAVCAFADITRSKELERELDRRRREAEEASVRKTRFLAAVSHDIRTPANAINLLAELIRRTAADPLRHSEIAELGDELKHSATSLVNLVSDVLDLARYDTGAVELYESEFVLADAVAEEIRQLTPLAQDKGLTLTLSSISRRSIRLHADRIKLGRIVSNLVGNAIKFTNLGDITVSLSLENRRPTIRVSDTGVGIKADALTRIFDEFFQLRNPERDSTKGTGLGLTICKRLVEAMGGTLSVESTLNVGSIFTLTLPEQSVIPHSGQTASDATENAAKQILVAHDSVESDGAGGLEQHRILLVENHDITRRAVRQLLTSRGATVVEAADGATALRLMDEHHPTVLLLDFMLPDMTGAEVLRQMSAKRPTTLRNVLVVTGDATEDRTKQVRDLGADHLIAKPVDVEYLISLLN